MSVLLVFVSHIKRKSTCRDIQLTKGHLSGGSKYKINNLHSEQGLYCGDSCCLVQNNRMNTPLWPLLSTRHVALEKEIPLIPFFPTGALLVHSKGLTSCPGLCLRGSPAQFNLHLSAF